MTVKSCHTITDPSGRELSPHGSSAFPVACYRHDFREGAIPWHWHDELEAVVAARGDTLVRTGQETVLVTEGNGFFLNSGVLHTCAPKSAGADCVYHSLVFHPRLVGGSPDSVFWQDYLAPALRACPSRPLLLQGDLPWQQEALSTIERAWQLCREGGVGCEFAVREQLSRLIFLLSQHLEPAPAGKADRVQNDRIKAMILFIQEHYAEDIRTRQIADSAAVSESECLRCFQRMIGTTPGRYLNRYRLRRAEELLKTTELKVSEIGERCGFREMSYFAKAFRGQYGESPSDYRNLSIRSGESDVAY